MTDPIREQQPRRGAQQGMPGKAKAFVGVTILTGLAVMAFGLRQWESANTPKFLCYLLLAVLASTCKVRLPRLTGTISANFLFILIGIADLSLPEVLVLGAAATLLQCLWRPSVWPSAVQVAFNVAALGISTAVGYTIPRMILGAMGEQSVAALLAMATVLFFVTNTLLVSTVLALLEEKPMSSVWQQCYRWALPYSLVGAVIASLMVTESRSVGWTVSLLILPLMYLVYLYFSKFVQHAAQERRLTD